MILKCQYLISGFTFITSSISVIIAASKPDSHESQLISKVSYIEKLSDKYESNTSEILNAAEKERNNLARIVKNLQETKNNGKNSDGTSIWGSGGNSKKSFDKIIKDFGWKIIDDPKKLEELTKYRKDKDNLSVKCQEWNNKSYNMLFINYLVWCTNKSPFLSRQIVV